jgi:asparagine synthase (glutamine-hydrolysing)
MGIIGWIDNVRDLRHEQPALHAVAAALNPTPGNDGVTRVGRRAAFARRGAGTGYADWRHPERPDPDLVLLLDGHLTDRERLEEQLYQRSRPLTSDAEILLHAYRRWGVALVDHIEGAYTIVIWDERARHLLLIRDPLGAKTLYFHPRPDGMLFSSQATALLEHPEVKRTVDADGLNELLTLGPVRTPGHGVICGVHELLPGELLRATRSDIRRHQYRTVESGEIDTDLPGAVAFLRMTLTKKTASLRRRPAGAVLMSGGIASTAAALFTTSELNGDRPTGYSLTMDAPRELSKEMTADFLAAAYTARRLQMQYHVVSAARNSLRAEAEASRRATDFPGPSNLDAPLFSLLRTAAVDNHTSVVTGHGARAMFGGYRWLHDKTDLTRDDFPWRPRGLAPVDLLNDDTRCHLLPAAYRKLRFDDAIAGLANTGGGDVLASRRRAMALLTLTHFLPNLLVRLDQLAGAAGITVHTPLADWDLARYLQTVPLAVRHPSGVLNGLLRLAVTGALPVMMTLLPGTPLIGTQLPPGWAQTQRDQLRDILSDRGSPLYPLLDHQRVQQLLEHPPIGRPRDWHTTVAYLIEVNDWLSRHRITTA